MGHFKSQSFAESIIFDFLHRHTLTYEKNQPHRMDIDCDGIGYHHRLPGTYKRVAAFHNKVFFQCKTAYKNFPLPGTDDHRATRVLNTCCWHREIG